MCEKDESGHAVIQNDNQGWDKIIWAVGAYNHYLSTGDLNFLNTAFYTVKTALTKFRKKRFNEKFGLFKAGSFFNDGIAGYTKDLYDDGEKSSFVGDHRKPDNIMCLSTNCIYAESYKVLASMAEIFGDNVLLQESKKLHKELVEVINANFFNKELNRYNYIVYPDEKTDDSREACGNLFAVLFSICDDKTGIHWDS